MPRKNVYFPQLLKTFKQRNRMGRLIDNLNSKYLCFLILTKLITCIFFFLSFSFFFSWSWIEHFDFSWWSFLFLFFFFFFLKKRLSLKSYQAIKFLIVDDIVAFKTAEKIRIFEEEWKSKLLLKLKHWKS